jgi:uncharacterized membrane protein YbhN (UPF0104 family)
MTLLKIIVYVISFVFFYPIFSKVIDNVDKWYASKVSYRTYMITNITGFILIIAAFIYVILVK